MIKFLRLTAKFLFWLLSLLVLGTIGALVYISFHPLSLEKLLPSGQGPLNWTNARFEYSSLELCFARAPVVRVGDGRLISQDGKEEITARLGELDIYMSFAELLRGRLAPKLIISRGLSLPLELSQQGFGIAGRWLGRKDDSNQRSFDLVDFLNQLQHPDSSLPRVLGNLEAFTIKDAKITFEDRIHQATWQADQLATTFDNRGRDFLSLTVNAVLQRKDSKLPLSFHLEHRAGADQAAIELSARFSGLQSLENYVIDDIAQVFEGETELRAKTVLRAGNSLDPAKITIGSRDGQISLPGVFGHPVEYSSLQVDTTLDPRDQGSVSIDNLQLVDRQGFTVKGGGVLKNFKQDPHIQMEVNLSHTTVDHLAYFFPDVAAPTLSRWLDQNLNQAKVKNARMEISGPLADFPFIEPEESTKFHAQFDFAGLQVRYVDNLPPGEALDGRFVMDRDRIVITADSGRLSMQQVSDLVVEISDVLTKGKPSQLSVRGDAAGSLKYLSEFSESHLGQLDNELSIRGSQRANVRLSLPLRSSVSPEDIIYSVRSRVRDLVMLVPEASFKLEAKSLDIEVGEKGILVTGKAKLNGTPVSISVRENIRGFAQGTQVHLETTLNSDFYLQYLPDTLLTAEGPIPLTLNVGRDNENGYAYTANLDLKNAKLENTTFNWQKDANIPGSLKLNGMFLAQDRILRVAKAHLGAPQLEVRATADLPLENLTQAKVKVKPFRIGGTDLDVSYKQAQVRISGRVLDQPSVGMRSGPAAHRSEVEEPEELDVAVAIDKVILEAGTLHSLSGRIIKKNGRWEVFDFDTGISEEGTSQVKLLEENGAPLLNLTSDDAGTMMKLLGVEDEFRGGRLRGSVHFPPGKAFDFEKVEGMVRLNDIHVIQSQTIFQILSYFSLQNWLSGDEGVLFRRVRIPLSIEKDVTSFTDARLEGPVLTIYGTGSVNTKTGDLDINGQAVPLRRVGRATQNIPLIGRAISNTQRNLTGVRFRISGTVGDSRVRLFGVKVSG